MNAAGRIVLCAVAAMSAVAAAPATAAGPPFYIGAWKLTGAVKAPWADPAHPLDPVEPSRLLGKTLVFKARGVEGPQPFACPGARYKIEVFGADMLFQGTFDEMRRKDPRVDPAKIAASLGFTATNVRTLLTGCEFDFHFLDATTAETGLNDYVYTLKKLSPAPSRDEPRHR